MSDLTPRSGNRLSRSTRQQRAYRLAMTGGAASVVFVAGLVLAIIGVVGAWLPILALLVAVAAGVMFRRTVS
jgi:CHASE2 domain-containing sensor protein